MTGREQRGHAGVKTNGTGTRGSPLRAHTHRARIASRSRRKSPSMCLWLIDEETKGEAKERNDSKH
ncbi:predicted protein [Coccidioides posadasii str. Silveira]|uniref:Predicted protein n=1 Tax=Coccidioides posadasii (strain RMSCC 757 / Silveira) TaxID=443226 RepID=E9D5N3_COCPS|nr:predicted protein [Coccidioides posadasii str. Silveira]